MTVCIAVACDQQADDGPKIVFCTDMMSSSDPGHTDNTLKTKILPQRWHFLEAGDIDASKALHQLLVEEFIDVDAAEMPIDETNSKALFEKAIANRKYSIANTITQSRIAMSYEDFLVRGKEKLPDDLFRQIFSEIDIAGMRCKAIVCGIVGGLPIILESDALGHVISDTMATIGSGEALAHASLMDRAFGDYCDLDEAIYIAYEAKKFSEGERHVGINTFMAILYQNGMTKMLYTIDQRPLEKAYKKHARRPVVPVLGIAGAFVKVHDPLEERQSPGQTPRAISPRPEQAPEQSE